MKRRVTAQLHSSSARSSKILKDHTHIETVVEVAGVGRLVLDVDSADLAIKCATHSGSNVGRKIRGSSVIAVHTYGVSRFSKPRTPATLNSPMCPRIHGEVCVGNFAEFIF